MVIDSCLKVFNYFPRVRVRVFKFILCRFLFSFLFRISWILKSHFKWIIFPIFKSFVFVSPTQTSHAKRNACLVNKNIEILHGFSRLPCQSFLLQPELHFIRFFVFCLYVCVFFCCSLLQIWSFGWMCMCVSMCVAHFITYVCLRLTRHRSQSVWFVF